MYSLEHPSHFLISDVSRAKDFQGPWISPGLQTVIAERGMVLPMAQALEVSILEFDSQDQEEQLCLRLAMNVSGFD